MTGQAPDSTWRMIATAIAASTGMMAVGIRIARSPAAAPAASPIQGLPSTTESMPGKMSAPRAAYGKNDSHRRTTGAG